MSGPRLGLPALQPGRHYRFHTMVKPGGAACNLDCSYCFYLHKEDLLHQPRQPRIDDALLEQHIRQYIEAQTGDEVVFSWQGGEPTLLGIDFFERVVELQARYRKPGQAIGNDLQTNGILLDDAWAAFLKRNDFLVGLSIDGPEDLHDTHRRAKGGQPTFARVMAAAELLRQNAVPFSALCTVNSANAHHPLRVYRFLRDEVRPRLIQFIPIVEPADFANRAPIGGERPSPPRLGEARCAPGADGSIVMPWSVPGRQWGTFLTAIWREWLRADFGRVFVDLFEDGISQLLGYGAQKCVSSKTCGKALALEHDGTLYSCDHFVYPEFALGNIMQTHEGDLAFSNAQIAFGMAKSGSLPGACRQCRHLELCWGECPKNRIVASRDGETGMNYLCEGLQHFYDVLKASKSQIERRLAGRG